MAAAFQDVAIAWNPQSLHVDVRFRLLNNSGEHWRNADGFALGWQIFDPITSTFICEGEWLQLENDVPPAGAAQCDLPVEMPRERGSYAVYISPVNEGQGWFYQQGYPFLLLECTVENGHLQDASCRGTTLAAMKRRSRWQGISKIFTQPSRSIWKNRSLIRSMVRREILSRYRGSFGDVFWTILNPLLLMATYFFVFGVVMDSRFGPDQSRTEFALYFLAGMLPWLPFSEAIGRSPSVILEHRVFVKKIVFPLETLPVNQVVAGLVTEAFALLVFLAALLITRHSVPVTVLWLPVLLIPQLLFTLGLSWFLSALGVFFRDLGQIIGLLITVWFFVTPICYPETKITSMATGILTKNPIYVLVRGYRAIFLESQAPEFHSLWKLWLLSIAVFLAGYGWFYKLRKGFADVI